MRHLFFGRTVKTSKPVTNYFKVTSSGTAAAPGVVAAVYPFCAVDAEDTNLTYGRALARAEETRGVTTVWSREGAVVTLGSIREVGEVDLREGAEIVPFPKRGPGRPRKVPEAEATVEDLRQHFRGTA